MIKDNTDTTDTTDTDDDKWLRSLLVDDLLVDMWFVSE